MKKTTVNRYLLGETIKIVSVSLLALYAVSVCVLLLSCWNNLSTDMQKDLESVETQLSEFIAPYKKRGHEINNSQSLLRLLTHMNINDSAEPEQTAFTQNLSPDEIALLSADETELYSRLSRVYPSYARQTISIPGAPRLQVRDDMLIYTMPVQNFTATETIGAIVQYIDPALLASYLDRTLPSNISVALYDADGQTLYSCGAQFPLKKEAALTSGVSGQVSVDLNAYVQLILLYILLTLPPIFLIFFTSYTHWKRTSEEFLQPMRLLLHTIQTSQIGGQRTKLPESRFEEFDILFASYEQFMDTTDRLVAENYKMNLLLTETKLNALQQSINPHFLFNTLEIISGQSMLEGAPTASRMAQKLGKIFRYSLREADIVTLGQELKQAEAYFYLRNACINHQVHLQMDVDGALSQIHLPKLTLQPLIENAFQYAFAIEKADMQIRIASSCENGAVLIRIQDNGTGISPEQLTEIRNMLQRDHTDFHFFTKDRTHIGLRNVSEKINIMFHTSDALTIDSKPGEGTCITIRLPLGGDDHV